MKTFIIYTTAQPDNLALEIVGGIYIVTAQSAYDAAGLWLERAENFKHTDAVGKETIERVDEVSLYGEGVITLQAPIIE